MEHHRRGPRRVAAATGLVCRGRTAGRPRFRASMDFSIAICTYNNARLLRRTLASVAAQRVPAPVRWELLLVDNNSTDATPAVAAAFADRLPLRYVPEPIQGLSAARRRAFRETVAPLVAFVDDDCLLAPDWVEQAVTFCQDHPAAGAVGGKVELEWEAPPNDIVRHYELCLARQDHGTKPHTMPARGYTYLVGAGLVLRRAAVAASGWLERGNLSDRRGGALSSGGDSELVLRIRRAGHELWYNPAMTLRHLIPKKRTSVRYLCRLQRGMGRCQVFLDGLGDDAEPTWPWRMRTVAGSLGRLARASRAALQDVRWFRQVRPHQRIALYHAFGYVEGSLSLLWRGYQL